MSLKIKIMQSTSISNMREKVSIVEWNEGQSTSTEMKMKLKNLYLMKTD